MTELAPPPAAPGTLTTAPRADAALAYLTALSTWLGVLRDTLDGLDMLSRQARDRGRAHGRHRARDVVVELDRRAPGTAGRHVGQRSRRER